MLSCSVVFCPVLSCPVLSRTVLYCPVLSCRISLFVAYFALSIFRLRTWYTSLRPLARTSAPLPASCGPSPYVRRAARRQRRRSLYRVPCPPPPSLPPSRLVACFLEASCRSSVVVIVDVVDGCTVACAALVTVSPLCTHTAGCRVTCCTQLAAASHGVERRQLHLANQLAPGFHGSEINDFVARML
jgi:hypothetical protein